MEDLGSGTVICGPPRPVKLSGLAEVLFQLGRRPPVMCQVTLHKLWELGDRQVTEANRASPACVSGVRASTSQGKVLVLSRFLADQFWSWFWKD